MPTMAHRSACCYSTDTHPTWLLPFGMVGRVHCPDCGNPHWNYTILATMLCRTCKRQGHRFMRTLSVSPVDANEPDGIQDLDNRVVDGIA